MKLSHLVSIFLLCFCIDQTVANRTSGQTSNNCTKKFYQILQTTTCLLCPLNAFLVKCPTGTRQLTTGMGLKKCILSLNQYGCVHLCAREIVRSVCCENYWGRDCQPCPGMESGHSACFGNGNCSDLEAGNGTCQCLPGFKGYACEMCTNPTKFGPKCEKECTCVNGICDSGVLGHGKCQPFSCQIGYHGENCEKFEQKCNRACHNHSHCDGIAKQCNCNPGYSGNGTVCQEIDPCKPSNSLCMKNADCHKTGPGRHRCVCRPGYTGDGVVCSAIDPCQRNYVCPANSTCNYVGPGKSNCTCLPGYDSYDAKNGCSIINLCIPDKDCQALNSECFMRAPGQKECRCRSGYAGNGTVCYGNILQRIDDLYGYGQFNDTFRHIKNIIKYHSDLTFPFTERGPFTVLLPTDAGIESVFNQSQLRYIITDKQMVRDFIMVHSAKAFVRAPSLNGVANLTTLKGWDAAVTKNGGLFYQLNGRTEKAQITTQDVFAWNGIIHVIDKPVWIPDFTKRFDSSRTLWDIVTGRPELRMFRDFIQAADMESKLKKMSTNGITLIAPANEAFSSLNKTVVDFLKSPKGKPKLQSIIRQHIFGLKIGVIDLSYKTFILTLAPEILTVNVSDKGALVLGEKSKLIENDIATANGYLQLSDNLLFPSHVLPIIQRRCDNTDAKPKNSSCVPCRLQGNCPQDYVATSKTYPCLYRIFLFIGARIYRGCKTLCLPKIKQCCDGFYGPDCLPCPGPIGNPCFGGGTCSDKAKGNGICTCKSNFKGTACELCKDKRKYGSECRTNCRCHRGICDNGRLGSGTCVPNSCQPRYSGDDCGTKMKSCNGSQHVISCHIHGTCYLNNSQPICLCNAGYEKVGQGCYEINPCLKNFRGGCDKNAICMKTAPGKSDCTCSVGWSGDGTYCQPINYCVGTSRGGCHRNAKCTFLGPAQVKCECNPGYEGDGTSCREINPCLKDNGKCSPLAQCTKTGPGNNSCTCRALYNGDGYTCLGSLAVVLKQRNDLTKISAYIVKYNLIRYLTGARNMTVFLPSDAAMSNLDDNTTKLLQNPLNIYYLGGANIAPNLYTLSTLRDRSVKTLQSLFEDVNITINHTESGEPLIGGIARIVVANITASNGILHIVDKVLLPHFVKEPRNELNISDVLCHKNTNFTEMCKFIKKFKLEEAIKNCNHCSIVVPTDRAFHSLSHAEYDKITPTDILYHMTNHYINPRLILESGQQFQSLAKGLYIFFQRNGKQVKVNGLDAKYYNSSSMWVIYTISEVLKAVNNTCYAEKKIVFKTQCRPCQFISQRCRSGFRFAGKEDCLYATFGSYFIGCRSVCEKPVQVRQCCPGFWGKECYACPGENGNVCSGHGECYDTTTGNGHCNCSENYDGFACERCKPGHFGSNCESCDCYGTSLCDQKNGFCLCPSNKKGMRCEKNATYENCLRIAGKGNLTISTCHQHASCSSNKTAKATCDCDYGYTGDGTSCKPIDLCDQSNNPCSPNAECSFDKSKMNVTCECKINYEGDGFYCRGKNPCVNHNGNCHKRADCLYLRPGRSTCKCKAGYSGDGEKSCVFITPCSQDNGGCSFSADCSFNERNSATICTCREGYIGNGTICVGNIFESIENDLNLQEFNIRLQDASIKNILSSQSHFSIIAPHNDAFTSSRRKRRSVDTLPDVDFKYYIIGCVALSESDVSSNTTLSFVTVAGWSLNISRNVINHNVTVLYVKVVANGAILVVDRLLDVPDKEHLENMTLIDAAKSKGYGKFVQLLTNADMLEVATNIYYRPHTVFWPSDEAFARLPQDIHKRLFDDKNYTSVRLDITNYHIIEKTEVNTSVIFSYSGGVARRTREGSPLYISCKGHEGDLYVNGQVKIIERDISYHEGVAFGIAEVLLPPGVAGRCDEIIHEKILGSCTACGDQGFCPTDAILESVDKNSSCLYQVDSKQYKGCLSRCLKRTKIEKCCNNFYGLDCQACPGGYNPCSGRGECNDGKTGNGTCSCDEPYLGWACELCREGDPKCIPDLKKCTSRRNPCSIFATCDVQRSPLCECWPGYEGDGYYCQEIDKCQTKNGGCSKHAICRYTGPNSASCECRSGFVGDGFNCTALSPSHPCAINNGNCHAHARCTDKGGSAQCSCRPGFVGNGISCAGSVKDVIYNVEDLSEFAKNLKRLSIGVEGNDIIRHLSSEKEYTVFAPINYGFTVKSLTINELKNHIVEGKISLKRSVVSLAGNKIDIKSVNNKIRLNNIANVVYDYPATNGMVYVIDHVLPYKQPPTTISPPTSGPTTQHRTTVVEGSVSASINNNPKIIGGTVGAIVLLVIIFIIVYYVIKRRKSYNVKYNRKNFENVLLESEPYTEEDQVEDDEYEHQMLQHPSTDTEGTTVQNPSYAETDADIQDELLEMTETSSSVPLAEHDATSFWEEGKC